MNILIYGTASGNRSPDQQGQAELLLGLNHNVFLLTHGKDDVLHRNFRAMGATAFSSAHKKGRSFIFFARQWVYLVGFCKQHQIDLVFCHGTSNAVIGGMANKFLKTRFIYVRHHTDEFTVLGDRKNIILSKLANRYSNYIVAISQKVKHFLLDDGVPKKKIFRVNLCYNFGDCLSSDVKGDPAAIRKSVDAEFLLLSISRLVKSKRIMSAFEVVKTLRNAGHRCGLIVIGSGEMEEELRQWIKDNQMDEYIKLQGFRANVLDYLKAADMLIHPSYSEASNQVVKEMGLQKKPVIVCNDVGDFDDYLVNRVNSIVVDKEDPIPAMTNEIAALIKDKKTREALGEELYQTVLDKFSIAAAVPDYKELLNAVLLSSKGISNV